MCSLSLLWAAGASGMIGTALHQRYPVTSIVRRVQQDEEAYSGPVPAWDPLSGVYWDDQAPIGVLLNLSGAGIAESKWTPARKKILWESRVLATRHLVDWMLSRAQRPTVLISVSAVGYYGDGGADVKRENASVGNGYLATLAQAWEAEALRAEEGGIRVVILRLGQVLSPTGGMLSRVLPLFKRGAGGPIGGGAQYLPWIHIEDLISIILWVAENQDISGPINAVAPGIVQQKEFAKKLGQAVNRPAHLPAPSLAIRLAMGELGSELLLQGQRAVPARLLKEGFSFKWPELPAALHHLVEQHKMS